MINKTIKIILLDIFVILTLATTLPGFIGDFILELKSSLGIIDRPNMAGPVVVFFQILFLIMFAVLTIYFNINEYKKIKK